MDVAESAVADPADREADRERVFRGVAVFALALLVRLVLVTAYPWEPDDVKSYKLLASNLIAGHGFSWSMHEPYEPNLYRTPVFPALLAASHALFGPTDGPFRVVQSVLGALTCCLVYAVALRYFSAGTALLAALLNAVYPYTSYFAGAIVSETLFTFLLALSVLSLTRLDPRHPRRTVVAGIAMGATALCRPEVQLTPFFLFPIWLVIHRNREWMRTGALYLATVLAVISPWVVRNSLVTGHPTGLTNRGPGKAFWAMANPRWDPQQLVYRDATQAEDPLLYDYRRSGGEIEEAALEPRMWREGLALIRQNPGFYLRRRAEQYVRYFLPSGDFLLGDRNLPFSVARREGRYGLVAAKAAIALVHGVLPFGLAVAGMILCRRRFSELWPLWFYPVYAPLSRLLFDTEPRYFLPAQPYMLVFAAVAIIALSRRTPR